MTTLADSRFEPLWWSIYREEKRDAWELGADVYMGDLETDDHKSSHLNGPESSPDFYRFPYTLWGDYIGDAVQRSNHRSILADFPDIFSDFVGFPGAHELLLPAEGIDPDTLDELIRIGQALRDDYPLYSDEDHSNLEMELADEAWDAYLSWDVMRSLGELGVDTDSVDENKVRELFYAATSEDPCSPYAETADSVVFPYYDDDVAYVVARLPKVAR
jgi:hypothetical protein